MTRQLATLAEGGTYFECPRWHDGRWWASDFYRHTVFTYDGDGREEPVLEVEGQPSGLGWLPGGDLLVVSMKDRRVLRRAADGTVSRVRRRVGAHHRPPQRPDRRPAGLRLRRQLRLRPHGRGEPATAALVRIDPDGSASVAAEDLWFPNGMVITDDGTLIVAETFAARFTAFTIQPDGALADRRIWAQVQPSPPPGDTEAMLGAVTFAPDGCTLDAEGHVWAANALAGALCRVAPGGEITEEIAMPDGLGVFACGLGGEDGRTLVACAAPDFHEEARKAAREAVLLSTTVDVPRAGLP